ncbi:MAG: hypothetical protein ACF787_07055 [Rhodopirellula sp. JB053]
MTQQIEVDLAGDLTVLARRFGDTVWEQFGDLFDIASDQVGRMHFQFRYAH